MTSIAKAVELLRAGDVVAFPTETVYGLGANANNPDAVRKIFRAKNRPSTHPVIVHIDHPRYLQRWVREMPPEAKKLADAFWPGPLTLVLRGGEGQLPDELRGREGGIAVRHTSHAGIARLVTATGKPLTSTSANRPGGPPAPGADRLVELFGTEERSGELLVLDGGVLGNVPPSTLVDCTDLSPRLVREGAIPRAELRRAAGRLAP